MKGSATTIVFDGYTPVKAKVTATRPDTAAERADAKRRRLHQVDTTLLAKLLAGTGITAEGWAVWSDPDERAAEERTIANAALAAILDAGGALPDGAFRNSTIITDCWSSCNETPGYRGRSRRGSAATARLAAALRQPLVAAGSRTTTVLPLNDEIEFFIPTTTADLIKVLTGQAELRRHRGVVDPNGAGDAATPRIPQNILELDSDVDHRPPADGWPRARVPRGTTPPAGAGRPNPTARKAVPSPPREPRAPSSRGGAPAAAARRRRPARHPGSRRAPGSRNRRRAARETAPAETPPAAGAAADASRACSRRTTSPASRSPGHGGPRIERPTRAPHWFTLAHTLTSMQRRTPAQTPERPSELDLAAHGVLILDVTPDSGSTGPPAKR